MISPIPIRHRQRRYKAKVRAATPRPVGQPLQMVGAYYDQNAVQLTLTFDRAIDIDAFDGSLLSVVDGVFLNATLVGDVGATLAGAATVVVPLVEDEPYDGGDCVLNAPADTGVVAVNDGGTWPGVTGYQLLS